jgi:hypothetical protein
MDDANKIDQKLREIPTEKIADKLAKTNAYFHGPRREETYFGQ